MRRVLLFSCLFLIWSAGAHGLPPHAIKEKAAGTPPVQDAEDIRSGVSASVDSWTALYSKPPDRDTKIPNAELWNTVAVKLGVDDICLLEAQRELRAKLCAMPKALKELYSTQVGAKAQAAYAKAQSDDDVKGMEQVARAFPCTEPGRQALQWLGTHALDRCERDHAANLFRAAHAEGDLSAKALTKFAIALYGSAHDEKELESIVGRIDEKGGLLLDPKKPPLKGPDLMESIKRSVTGCPRKAEEVRRFDPKDKRQYLEWALSRQGLDARRKVKSPSEKFVALAAGGSHTCAVSRVGTVQCWGGNGSKQSDVPDDLPPVTSVVAGAYHSCALTAEGKVRCWGNNGFGQQTPPPDLPKVVALSAGYSHTCATTVDGKVRCWGHNVFKQRGDAEGVTEGFKGIRDRPHDLAGVTATTAGEFHTCAVDAGRKVSCWGYNVDGQADPPKDLGEVTAVSAGESHTCALTSKKRVTCWGKNEDKQAPASLDDLPDVTAIAAARSHTCALTEKGKVKCWGKGVDEKAQAAIGELSEVVSISAGQYHSCALTKAGDVRCWGEQYGEKTAYKGLNEDASALEKTLKACPGGLERVLGKPAAAATK